MDTDLFCADEFVFMLLALCRAICLYIFNLVVVGDIAMDLWFRSGLLYVVAGLLQVLWGVSIPSPSVVCLKK